MDKAIKERLRRSCEDYVKKKLRECKSEVCKEKKSSLKKKGTG